jgi:hypothetical protein
MRFIIAQCLMFIDVKFFELNNLGLAWISRLCYRLQEKKTLGKHELIFWIRFVRFGRNLIEI